MNKILIAVAMLIIVGGGYYWYTQQAPKDDAGVAQEQGAPSQGKLDMNVVCNSALAYMTFPDAASAEVFVEECKEGKHPEVVERYKADMNLGAGAAI